MADARRPTIAELEEAMARGERIQLRPDGTVEYVEAQDRAESFLSGLAELRQGASYY